MSDEIIREVRSIRHKISEECGHDLHKLFEYYRAYEEEMKRSGKYRFADPREVDRGKVEPESPEQCRT